jgi:ribosome-interacting GTPase 1
MKVHKAEVLILDFEDYGVDDVITVIEQNRYYIMNVMDIKSKEIDNWTDDHFLNKKNVSNKEINDFFKDK